MLPQIIFDADTLYIFAHFKCVRLHFGSILGESLDHKNLLLRF